MVTAKICGPVMLSPMVSAKLIEKYKPPVRLIALETAAVVSPAVTVAPVEVTVLVIGAMVPARNLPLDPVTLVTSVQQPLIPAVAASVCVGIVTVESVTGLWPYCVVAFSVHWATEAATSVANFALMQMSQLRPR